MERHISHTLNATLTASNIATGGNGERRKRAFAKPQAEGAAAGASRGFRRREV